MRRLSPINLTIVLAALLATAVTALPAQALPTAVAHDQTRSVLTLDGFLNQVQSQNESYRGVERLERAGDLRADEASLLTAPYVFGALSQLVDKRETAAAVFQGTETDSTNASIGIGQKTKFGLDAKLSYNWAATDILGAAAVPVPSFITAGPVIELTQSLWKNGFGSETRANQEVVASKVTADKLDSRYSKVQLETQAEGAYWRLAVAREAVTATQESLDRAVRSRRWMAERTKYELADRADLLQGEAAVALREMESQKAKDEAKSASRDFNTVRGIDEAGVDEKLSPITEELIKSLNIPERKEARADVQAALAKSVAARASSRLGEEANKPSVDLFASMGLNGRDPTTRPAIDESFGTNYPNYTIGLKVNFSLNQATQSRAREGYRIQSEAQDLIYHRKTFENDREWTDLTQKFAEGKNRLSLAQRLEQAQKVKLDTEKERLRRGRTTTYQVILFEEDFANAQLNRIRMEAEVLGVYSQLKTFGSVNKGYAL